MKRMDGEREWSLLRYAGLMMILLSPLQDAYAGQNDVPAPPSPDQDIETIVVTGTVNDPSNSSGSKVVVNQTDLMKFGDTNLSEIMKRLPGVTVSPTGAVSLRGFSSGYTQILINGQKAPQGFTLDSLMPESILRIEIIRSGSAEMSADAIAGTINIILKKATSTPQSDIKLGLASARGRAEPSISWEETGSDGNIAYFLNGLIKNRDFLDDSTETERGIDPAGRNTFAESGHTRVSGTRDDLLHLAQHHGKLGPPITN